MKTILITRPTSGQHISVEATADATFSLGFSTAEVTLEHVGNDLTFKFEDGSSAKISDFYTEYTKEINPDFEVDGSVISSKEFFAAMGPDLMPAAGQSAAERSSHYTEHSDSELAQGIDHLNELDYSSQLDGSTLIASETVNQPVDTIRSEGFEGAPVAPVAPVPPPMPNATTYHERLVLSHGSQGDTISFYVRDAGGAPINDHDRLEIAFADSGQKWFDSLSIDPISGKISVTLTADGVAALKSGNPFFTNLEVTVDGKPHIMELYGKENNSYELGAPSAYQSANYNSTEQELNSNLEGKLVSETFTSINREVKYADINLTGAHHNDVTIESTVNKILNSYPTYDTNATIGIEASKISSSSETLNVSIDIKGNCGTNITGITSSSSVTRNNETNIASNGGDLNLNMNLDSQDTANAIDSANVKDFNTGTIITTGGGNLNANLSVASKYFATGLASVQSSTGLYSEGGDLDLNLKVQSGASSSSWQSTGLYAGGDGHTEVNSAGGDLNVNIETTGGSKLVTTEPNLAASGYGMKALGSNALNEINSETGQLTVTIKVTAGHAQNACAMFAAGGKNLIETTSSENAHVTITAMGDDGRGTAMGTNKASLTNTQTGVTYTVYGTNEIRTGSGDDRIEINGNITAANVYYNPYSNIINAGDGNNTIILNGAVQASSLKIITGDGYDTLVLKADNFEQLKSFYGPWLAELQRKGMIKEMSIDCIDIQCGDTATALDTLAWLKGVMGTDMPKVTLNDGETIVHEPAAAAVAMSMLDPDSHDDKTQAQQSASDDSSHNNHHQVLSASLIPEGHDDHSQVSTASPSPEGHDNHLRVSAPSPSPEGHDDPQQVSTASPSPEGHDNPQQVSTASPSPEGHDDHQQVSSAPLFEAKNADATTPVHEDIPPVNVDTPSFDEHHFFANSREMLADEGVVSGPLFVGIDALDTPTLEMLEHAYGSPSTDSNIEDLFVEGDSLDSLFSGEMGIVGVHTGSNEINSLEVVNLTNREALEEIKETITEDTHLEVPMVENSTPTDIAPEVQIVTAEDTSRQIIELGQV